MIDLAVLDIRLSSSMDGLELLARIQQLRPTQHAILVSGHARSERLQAAMRSGITFLPKPFTGEDLMRIVSKVLKAPPPRPVEAGDVTAHRVVTCGDINE